VIRRFVRSLIRGATVTAVQPDRAAGLAVDVHLLNAAGLLAYEQVEVVNLATGERFDSWVVPGESGEVSVAGVRKGDTIAIVSYGLLHDGQAIDHRPRVIDVDAANIVLNLLEEKTTIS
jgi:aspartate 1-decarboxylase